MPRGAAATDGDSLLVLAAPLRHGEGGYLVAHCATMHVDASKPFSGSGTAAVLAAACCVVAALCVCFCCLCFSKLPELKMIVVKRRRFDGKENEKKCEKAGLDPSERAFFLLVCVCVLPRNRAKLS